MVLARDRKVEPLPSSLLGRQGILVATTSHEINPLLALRANPASSNALAQLQRVQPGPTGLGRDRMPPTGSDSTRKQSKDCVTGKAKRLDGTTQNVIITIHWRDRHHHDHDWWRHHCDAIVFVGGGFWGWYDGWWYPAWGYDPYYSYYDYNGPIYGYDGLQPDEVIADVQAALQQLGYYAYAVDGVLGPATEAAIANYQRDYGLPVTGAIDPPTVRSLGLSS